MAQINRRYRVADAFASHGNHGLPRDRVPTRPRALGFRRKRVHNEILCESDAGLVLEAQSLSRDRVIRFLAHTHAIA